MHARWRPSGGHGENVDGVHVSLATCPGSVTRSNEDFVAASPSVAVVLDGLSAPAALGTGCIHGIAWFVAQLGTLLMSAVTTAHEEPLQDLVASAIRRWRTATHTPAT
jgi:Na+/H+ antiporter NhaC